MATLPVDTGLVDREHGQCVQASVNTCWRPVNTARVEGACSKEHRCAMLFSKAPWTRMLCPHYRVYGRVHRRIFWRPWTRIVVIPVFTGSVDRDHGPSARVFKIAQVLTVRVNTDSD